MSRSGSDLLSKFLNTVILSILLNGHDFGHHLSRKEKKGDLL